MTKAELDDLFKNSFQVKDIVTGKVWSAVQLTAALITHLPDYPDGGHGGTVRLAQRDYFLFDGSMYFGVKELDGRGGPLFLKQFVRL